MIGKLQTRRQENTKISPATITVKSGHLGSSPVEAFWPKSTVGILSLERNWKILFFNEGKQSVLYGAPFVEMFLVLYFTCLFLCF